MQKVTPEALIAHQFPTDQAAQAAKEINHYISLPREQAWQAIASTILHRGIPFAAHQFLFQTVYPEWPDAPENAAAWIPSEKSIPTTNLSAAMQKNGFTELRDFHHWSHASFRDFWKFSINTLGIAFKKTYSDICDLSQGAEKTQWLVNAKLNIVDSCFQANPDATALVFQSGNTLEKISFSQLETLVNQIANGLISSGYKSGDPIAIIMPMTMYAVAIYLAIIKMGGIVVSIADSFSSDEIKTRLDITQAKGVFTQDVMLRNQKILPLYDKVQAAHAHRIIVLPATDVTPAIRSQDLHWHSFLSTNTIFESVACDPMQACNILFSSGTTGTPKAIPWKHCTAIKAATDAFFHHNIQPNDVLAWPTNLGWMMGPWLIFAALINRSAIAVYSDVPTTRAFGQFIQDAGVTMLGTVPTLVATWKQSQCMQGLNWDAIKVFSSTGECSNAVDMLYLMSLANYKPIIEYCGGTEIGGAYISSTVIQPNCPSVFTIPTMGTDFVLLDGEKNISDTGQVALIPPILGLSTDLLNANHHEIYYADMPTLPSGEILRKHGDQLHLYANGYYSVQGRMDDTMNLGGIKISAVELERAIVGIEGIAESAAVAISPIHNGPSQLVIYSVRAQANLTRETVKNLMQQRINQHLNPLFKIHDVIFVEELPKTASNKIMRRQLRDMR